MQFSYSICLVTAFLTAWISRNTEDRATKHMSRITEKLMRTLCNCFSIQELLHYTKTNVCLIGYRSCIYYLFQHTKTSRSWVGFGSWATVLSMQLQFSPFPNGDCLCNYMSKSSSHICKYHLLWFLFQPSFCRSSCSTPTHQSTDKQCWLQFCFHVTLVLKWQSREQQK